MKCPSCNTTLQPRDTGVEGFAPVDYCSVCRGCWLDLSVLEGTLSGVWSDLDQMGVTTAEVFADYICPHCTARLVSVTPDEHPELRIDRCPSCHGLWFDNGEIEKLRRVLVESAEHEGTLHDRPADWSMFRWIGYKLFQHWQHHSGASAA